MPEDRKQVRALAREGHAECDPDPGFDDAAFERTFECCLTSDPTMFVAEHKGRVVGCLIARIEGSYFASGVSTSLDLIYVTPGSRGSRAPALLFIAFLRWSDEVGAMRKKMCIDNSLHPDRTARFFERFGARRVGFALVV